VHPTFTHVFMPFKFAEAPEAQEELKRFNAKAYAGLLGEIEAMAKRAADAGKPWLGGERLGPLDVYALVLLRWGGFAKIDPTTYPALWAHVQKVAQQPGVARAVERERLQLNLYKP
jgi:glutathione S-transferase